MSGQTQFLIRTAPSPSSNGAPQVLTACGELDLSTAPELRMALRTASGAVVIDCKALTFMDAAGISVLVEARSHLDSIRLTNVSPMIRKVISIVGLERHLLGDGAYDQV